MAFLKVFAHLVIVLLLSVLTQVGGIVYLISRILKYWKPGRLDKWYFPALYLVVWLMIPLVSPFFGRVALPIWATAEQPVQPQNWLMILANRHYVKPELRDITLAVAADLNAKYGEPLTYLDANFPFIEGFPLLPHRSHDDGEKLDVSFWYRKSGKLHSRAPAFLGYGRCEEPKGGEFNQPAGCRQSGYWQYSLLRPLGRIFAGNRYELDEDASRQMVRAFARAANVRKLFLEPHLKQRWRLGKYGKIRFHGCAAVRHDDHLHIQM